MSIFGKAVSQLDSNDLYELLQSAAVENVRLEFKRDAPGKIEMLKKLSSFANTFGGFIVVGAEAKSQDGRIIGLPGVEPQSSYKQTVVQWCFEGASPPLNVEVSEPIAIPSGGGRVCYVISIRESELAPHFLNGRKGVYVRTDEFSGYFEPELANENELRRLLNRRELILKRRTELIERARLRFQSFTEAKHASFEKERRERRDAIGGRFDLAILPRFPSQPLCGHAALLALVKSKSIPCRQTGFPARHFDPISQHESAVMPGAGFNFSIVEVNVWGMFFFASELQERTKDFEGIHLSNFLGSLLVFVRYAGVMLKELGFDGDLQIELRMEGMRGVPWITYDGSLPETGPFSEFDDKIAFGMETNSISLLNDPDGTALNILRFVLFATNWERVAGNEQQLRQLLKEGYKFNSWAEPKE